MTGEGTQQAARLAWLIAEVREGADYEEGALEKLFHEGDSEATLLALLAAIEKGFRRALGLSIPATIAPLLRLGFVLASFRDLRALTLLAKLAARGYEAPLERALVHWRQASEPEQAQALLHLLEQTVPLSLTQHLTLMLSPTPFAQELVALAERNPLPELRAALPLLRFSVGKPRAFRELHHRLQKALGDESLPIPATPPQPMANLPVPTAKEAGE
jgi:hypothetical protein